MFNITYNKLGIITTGILTIGAIVYYYFDGKPPMVTEKQLAVDDVESDSDN